MRCFHSETAELQAVTSLRHSIYFRLTVTHHFTSSAATPSDTSLHFTTTATHEAPISHLEHPGAGLGPVLDEGGAQFEAGPLQAALPAHPLQTRWVPDGLPRGLVRGPHALQGYLRWAVN